MRCVYVEYVDVPLTVTKRGMQSRCRLEDVFACGSQDRICFFVLHYTTGTESESMSVELLYHLFSAGCGQLWTFPRSRCSMND
jgi:hypothetical protein